MIHFLAICSLLGTAAWLFIDWRLVFVIAAAAGLAAITTCLIAGHELTFMLQVALGPAVVVSGYVIVGIGVALWQARQDTYRQLRDFRRELRTTWLPR